MPPGTRLGRYEIIGELGTGGMATVYEGRALSVGGFARRVAIKYLHPHLLRDEQFVQMFMDEGRLAARIHHPNVVGVVDLVLEPNCMYMVSEFVEGDQLLALFRNAREHKTRIPTAISLRIALDMLAGLHAAHELTGDDDAPLRIVHRDVSPHNVLVGADGITRITDFGIAKAEERISTTRDGIVKGKLSYMAPEQPDDAPVDRRADLFSAATVLWECLTSRRLFPGKSDREVLDALLNKPIPSARELVPDLPEVLDEALMKGLARNPDERYATAAEFAEALEGAAVAVGIATPREVARYVEQKSATKLVAERERRRAMTTRELPVYRPSMPDAPAVTTGPVPTAPTAVRTDPGLGPPRDPDDQPTMLSAPHSIRQLRNDIAAVDGAPRDSLPPVAVAAPPVPAATPAPALTKPATAPAKPAHDDERRTRVWPLALAVLFAGSALGYGIWWMTRPAPTVNTVATMTATAPAPAQPAPLAQDLAPAPPEPAAPAPPPPVETSPTPAVTPPTALAPPSSPPVEGAPRTAVTPRAARPRPTVHTTAPSAPAAPARPAPEGATDTPAAPAGPRLPRHI